MWGSLLRYTATLSLVIDGNTDESVSGVAQYNMDVRNNKTRLVWYSRVRNPYLNQKSHSLIK